MRKTSASSNTLWIVAFSACADGRSRPNGFSTMMRAPAAPPALARAPITVRKKPGRGAQALDRRREDARRDRQVVGRVLRVTELFLERRVHPLVPVVALDVGQVLRENVEHLRLDLAVLLEALPRALAELLDRRSRARDADQWHVDLTARREAVEG